MSSRKSMKGLLTLAASLLFLATGFTDCQYFQTVTVPKTDTSAPAVCYSVYNPSTAKYDKLECPTEKGIWYSSKDFRESKVLLGAATDPGGVKSLTVTFWEAVTCCRKGLCNKSISEQQTVYTDSQTGTTGSKVSNGIYLNFAWAPSSRISKRCGSGFDSTSHVKVRWQATAKDFKGNTTTGPLSYAYY